MKRKSLVKRLSTVSAILIATFVLTDCTSMITEEQMAQLEELRRQEATIGDGIAKANKTISKLDGELSSRKAELKDCEEQKAFIEQKLKQWPNVWPDWTPPVEEEENAETAK